MKTHAEIIADFLGWKICTSADCAHLPLHYRYGLKNWQVILVKDMKFDKSWDALIPVIAFARKAIVAAGWGTPTEKEAKSRLKMALNETANLNIHNAHYCLVKFIEWYNQNKPDHVSVRQRTDQGQSA